MIKRKDSLGQKILRKMRKFPKNKFFFALKSSFWVCLVRSVFAICSIKKTLGVMYDSKFMQLGSFISEVARLCSKETQISHQNPDHRADAEVVPEVWRVSLPARVLCGNAPTFAAFSRQVLDAYNWRGRQVASCLKLRELESNLFRTAS